MKLGIDFSPALGQGAGIGRYTRQLVANLLAGDGQNSYHLYSFFGARFPNDLLSHPRVETSVVSANGRLMRALFAGLRLAGRTPDRLVKGVDVFHATDLTFPALRKTPSVLTIQDLIFIRYPQYFTRLNRSYMKAMVGFSAKQAKIIIASSNATKADIIEFLDVPDEKIKVIYLGISDFSPASPAGVSSVRQRYGLPESYGLYVGTLEPRKNLGLVLQAMHLLKERKQLDWQFVLAGGKGWLYEGFLNQINELGLSDQVKLIGFVPDEDLSALYTGADFFIYPSVYEGFGFPPLEAMACGTPTVVASTPTLLETAGEAALFVDPFEPEDLAQAIEKLKTDEGLKRRLSGLGIEHSRSYSWSKTADQTLKVYEEITHRL